MIPEIDIWRAARLLLKQHEGRAAQAADQRAAELEQSGDAEGHAVWLRIAKAVRDLQRRLAEGEPLN